MAKSTATRSTRRRSPGEGSVYRNGVRWRGAVTWTEPDGTRQRRIVSAATSDEAREKLDELRRKLRFGGASATASRQTVGAFLEGWIERDRGRVRPSTWHSRSGHVRLYLIPALGRHSLATLGPADVERALTSFVATGAPRTPGEKRGPGRRALRGVSPMTARHVRATLRRALADAVRDGLAIRNAAADARPPRVPHRPIAYLTGPDLHRLLAATREHEYGPIYALAATTGLRQGELLGLSWDDVDLIGGTLTVRRSMAMDGAGGWELAEPKSARSRRTIPLPRLAREALERRRTVQDRDRAAAGTAWQDRARLVFTDTLGRPLGPGSVSYAFRKARADAGLPPIRFHDLRHSMATSMLAEGVPLAVVSDWLGHAGIAITAAHYAAVTPQLHRDAAAAVDRAMGGHS